MAKLRINDIPASAGQRRRVEVTWEDGRAAPRVAVAEFDAPPDAGDGERIRWYLEDYAEFPADPAPVLAAAAEARLAQTGEDLFRRVFSSDDALGIWERARDRLSEVRIEVDIDPDTGPGLAWELLRDPGRDAALALSSGAFVRTHRVANITSDVTDPATDSPLPGREGLWTVVTAYRIQLAIEARDWPNAITLQNALIAQDRQRASTVLDTPAAALTPQQRRYILNLSASLNELGRILIHQGDPSCLQHLLEALSLDQRIGDRAAEAQDAGSLGNAYMTAGLRDLDQAERWYRHSLSLRAESDLSGRARCAASLGAVASARFDEALDAHSTQAVLLRHFNAVVDSFEQVLELTRADDHELRANAENHLGNIYQRAGDNRNALRHYQQSIKHSEARGNVFGAGDSRLNIAILLAGLGQITEALHYAHAGLRNYEQIGPGAAGSADTARQLIADLERRMG